MNLRSVKNRLIIDLALQDERFAKVPIGLEGGMNPYAYAGNDPVNMADPSGLRFGESLTDSALSNYSINNSINDFALDNAVRNMQELNDNQLRNVTEQG